MKINNQISSNFPLSLWFLYLLLFPFQLYPPGSPQIADAFLVVGITTVLLSNWNIDIYTKSLSYFVVYAILIGIFYSLFYYNIEFLKLPVNYLYCLTSLFFVSRLSNYTKFIPTTILAMFFSSVIQFCVFLMVGFDESQFRFVLFFNNPNQLGLWALTQLVLISLFVQKIEKSNFIVIVLIISAILTVLFIALSISQAAIISASLIIIYLSIYFFRLRVLYFFLPVILVTYGLCKNELKNSEIKFLINIQNRIDNEVNEDDGDNGLEGRNYTRLFDYPKFLLIGSGEGKFERFGQNGLEIHSTYANVLFSYGLVGFCLFLYPVIIFIKRKSFYFSFILILYLIFTLVHNTIRWPLFWIVPYLMYLMPSTKCNFVSINIKANLS